MGLKPPGMPVLPLTRRAFAAGAAAATTLPSCALATLAPDAEKELYAAAQKEGEVTLYTAHYAADLAERFGSAFGAKYPGVKVNVVRTTAQVAFQRLSQELKSGGPQVDLLQTTDIGHCVELKSKGLLEKYIPANATTMIPSLQNVDPDGSPDANSAKDIQSKNICPLQNLPTAYFLIVHENLHRQRFLIKGLSSNRQQRS